MPATKLEGISRVCCYGAGLIGSGWAAHFLRAGLDVVAYDPSPQAESFLRRTIEQAWPVVTKLGLAPGASPERVRFTSNPAAATAEVDFIQESAVEDEALKIKLLAEIDRRVPAEVIIASSSSGFLAKSLRSQCARGGRVIVGHPFNPPYLIPLVELAAGEGADAAVVERAMRFYAAVGSKPILLRREIDGYIANRIQCAVFREILHMYGEGVASIAEIDDAVTYGPALRWAVMGPSRVFYLGSRSAETYPRFYDLVVGQIEQGGVAPADMTFKPELRERYIAELGQTIDAAARERLRLRRDHGVAAIREGLAAVK